MLTFCLIAITLAFIFLLLWMKRKMAASKGYFALATLCAIVACLSNMFDAIMQNSLSKIIIGKIFPESTHTAILETGGLIAIVVTVIVAIVAIYRFAAIAVKNWDAPLRVSEAKLSENGLDNNLLSLAAAQLYLIIRLKKDPIAGDYAVNWQGKPPELPRPVEVKDLLRSLLTTYCRESCIEDSGWRDQTKLWVGDIYGSTDHSKSPLLAVIFDTPPTEHDVSVRIKNIFEAVEYKEKTKIFGLYISEDGIDDISGTQTVGKIEIEMLSSKTMVYKGLDLKYYARELLRKFHSTKVGGTNATLEQSYVELTAVNARSDTTSSQTLLSVLESWTAENSKKHLALTGEYGQGKSTALLKYCCDWAERFLQNDSTVERIPLLIELRGKNPAEQDPLAFISTWCSRYGLVAEQVMNLIKSGNAIIIFEGFDELLNSGREFDRHQHFNALWGLAYPKTKIIFTGRPNFFLDEKEANKTLRHDSNQGASGSAYTEVWRLEKLNRQQIKEACRSYDPIVTAGICKAIDDNEDFLEIISRPSMLPVVATIWHDIEDLQRQGEQLTGALLIERYLRAIYARKEAELEQDRVNRGAPSGSRYLVLPRSIRELLTICIAWRMSGAGYKNTISRPEINELVSDIYTILFDTAKIQGVSPDIAEGLLNFEKKHEEKSTLEKIEIITSDICSAGILVPDPAGGSTNLMFPHKQFYEFLIAKAICITGSNTYDLAKLIILISSKNKSVIKRLSNETNAIKYLTESYGPSVNILFNKFNRIFLLVFTYGIYKFMKLDRLISSSSIIISVISGSIISGIIISGIISISGSISIIIISSIIIFGIGASIINIISIINNTSTTTNINISSSTSISITNSSSSSSTQMIIILGKFITCHLGKLNKSINYKREFFLIIFKTLLKGRVIFPKEHVISTTDLDQFLSPAQDFGKNHK